MRTFKFGLSAILSIALVCASTHSFAAILSSWNFQTNTPADLSNSTAGPIVASEAGLYPGSFTGVHADAASDWTTPAGNGSTDAYSVNTWTVGDFSQISTSSAGYENLTLTFDATGSNTGPKDFKVQASTDGVTYTDIGFSYSLTNDAWSPAAANPVSTKSTLLPASLNDQASIFIRLVQTSTTSINLGTVATGGTSRIDNISIEGIALVPEPSSIALMFVSVGALAFRRK
jgi:hypothetical protein